MDGRTRPHQVGETGQDHRPPTTWPDATVHSLGPDVATETGGKARVLPPLAESQSPGYQHRLLHRARPGNGPQMVSDWQHRDGCCQQSTTPGALSYTETDEPELKHE